MKREIYSDLSLLLYLQEHKILEIPSYKFYLSDDFIEVKKLLDRLKNDYGISYSFFYVINDNDGNRIKTLEGCVVY